MNKSASIALPALFYLLLTGSQCTETVTSTEVRSSEKISAEEGGFSGDLDSDDRFGSAIANIDDLESDGVIDLAVGAPYDDDGGDDRGAVWILFMNSNGSVDINRNISNHAGTFGGGLDDNDRFGAAVAGIGDLNGDGFADIAVGAPYDDDGGDNRGAVWVLFLNADGTVRVRQKISSQQGNFNDDLKDNDLFGSAIAAIGDLDGDGISDLAVGAPRANDNGERKGAIWILFMNTDGTVRSSQRISDSDGNFDGNLSSDDRFGASIAGIGDLNRDGIRDLVVGASGHSSGGVDRGAIWVLFMRADGKVNDERKIAPGDGGFEEDLDDNDRFGAALASIGDLDDNGVNDLAVGAPGDGDGGTDRGATWVLFMKNTGKVDSAKKISDSDGKLDADLTDGDQFGSALAGLGNLDSNNAEDFAAGIPGDDDDNNNAGALLILFMERKEDEERVDFFN